LAKVSQNESRAEILEPQIQTRTGDFAVRFTVTYEYTIQTADGFYVARIDAFKMGSRVTSPPIDLAVSGDATNPTPVVFAIE
jgi:hypothetical protein